MKKITKTMIKIGGALAVMDIVDMVATGNVLIWMRVAHPEAAEDFEDNPNRLRSKIIYKIADIFEWIYADC